MKKIAVLLLALGMALSVQAQTPAIGAPGSAYEPIDFLDEIARISPLAGQVLKDSEKATGRRFLSYKDVGEYMKTDDYKDRMDKAVRAFCAKPENADSLGCL